MVAKITVSVSLGSSLSLVVVHANHVARLSSDYHVWGLVYETRQRHQSLYAYPYLSRGLNVPPHAATKPAPPQYSRPPYTLWQCLNGRGSYAHDIPPCWALVTLSADPRRRRPPHIRSTPCRSGPETFRPSRFGAGISVLGWARAGHKGLSRNDTKNNRQGWTCRRYPSHASAYSLSHRHCNIRNTRIAIDLRQEGHTGL